MRPSTFLHILPVAVTFATCTLPAQKVCNAENETVPPTFSTASVSWFCLERTTSSPMVIGGVEFLLRSTGPTTGVNVGIWDKDPVTGKPRTLLGSAPVTNLVPNVGGFYGGVLAPPVVLATPGNYFVGVQIVAGVQPSLARAGGVVTPHWWNPTAGWSGPHASGCWAFRIHCGLHAGHYVSYGTAQAGSGNAVPAATGLGFPNTTNPIQLVASGALGGAQGAFVFGPRGVLPLPPFGTLYAVPIVSVPVTFQGMGPGAGFAGVDLVVPNDPALHQQQVAWQAVVVDAGAASGVAHTQGVEITFGH